MFIKIKKFVLPAILAVVVNGLAVLNFSDVRAGEVSVNYDVIRHIVLYQDDETMYDQCYVNWLADSAFECVTYNSRKLTGKITGITNNVGIVTGYKIAFSLQVSDLIQANYSGSIKKTLDSGSYQTQFAAGTYERIEMRKYYTSLGRPITITAVKGPFPFKLTAGYLTAG